MAAETNVINQDKPFSAKASYDAKSKVEPCLFARSYAVCMILEEGRAAKPSQQAPKGAGKAQLQPTQQFGGNNLCHFCHKPGHTAKNCYKNPASVHNAGGKGGKSGRRLAHACDEQSRLPLQCQVASAQASSSSSSKSHRKRSFATTQQATRRTTSWQLLERCRPCWPARLAMQPEHSRALTVGPLQRVVWSSAAAVALARDGRIRMLFESLCVFRPKVHPSGCQQGVPQRPPRIRVSAGSLGHSFPA